MGRNTVVATLPSSKFGGHNRLFPSPCQATMKAAVTSVYGAVSVVCGQIVKQGLCQDPNKNCS